MLNNLPRGLIFWLHHVCLPNPAVVLYVCLPLFSSGGRRRFRDHFFVSFPRKGLNWFSCVALLSCRFVQVSAILCILAGIAALSPPVDVVCVPLSFSILSIFISPSGPPFFVVPIPSVCHTLVFLSYLVLLLFHTTGPLCCLLFFFPERIAALSSFC